MRGVSFRSAPLSAAVSTGREPTRPLLTPCNTLPEHYGSGRGEVNPIHAIMKGPGTVAALAGPGLTEVGDCRAIAGPRSGADRRFVAADARWLDSTEAIGSRELAF